MKRLYRLFLLGGMLAMTGCTRESPKPTTSQTPVVTASCPVQKEVVDYEDYTGRTDATSTVEIRARVTGYLTKVTFKDGDYVTKDQLLYEIDPRPFQAALDQALGQVERFEAQKKLLAIQVARYEKLVKTSAASQQDLDQYLAQQAENVGSLKASQAQAEQARLNLGFTRIQAPISGRISRTLLTVGNLVAADTSLLTTLVSVDPMYAYFDIEEPVMLRLRKMIRDGVIKTKQEQEVPIAMGLADDLERKFPHHGSLNFVNNVVDAQTGTIQVRAVFPNPYEGSHRPPVLTPGLFVRVRLPMSLPHSTLLVHENALGTDQGKRYVYVVGEGNKVSYRPVTLGLQFDGLQAITQGLGPQDRVIVNGLQRVRPGLQVQVEEVKMSAAGGPSAPTATP